MIGGGAGTLGVMSELELKKEEKSASKLKLNSVSNSSWTPSAGAGGESGEFNGAVILVGGAGRPGGFGGARENGEVRGIDVCDTASKILFVLELRLICEG